MKFVKSICSILVVAIIALVCFFSSNVQGTWYYAMNEPGSITVHLSAGKFAWEGSGDLPGGGGTIDPDDPDVPVQPPVGENHLALIKRIVESDVGLNNDNSFLSNYIEDRIGEKKDSAASVAPTPGGNLKSIFNTAEIAKLDFMIHIIMDSNNNITAYEIYTFETALVGTREGIEADPVYKTILDYYEGRWVPVKTMVGKGYSMRYDAKQGGGKYMTINPHSWVQTV